MKQRLHKVHDAALTSKRREREKRRWESENGSHVRHVLPAHVEVEVDAPLKGGRFLIGITGKTAGKTLGMVHPTWDGLLDDRES